jgi:DNA repair protein RadC
MIPDDLAAPVPIAARRRRPDLSARLELVGPEAASDDELLAALIGPGSNAGRLARRLLDRFGGLVEVARAEPLELRIAGLAAGPSIRPSAALELAHRVARRPPEATWMVRTPGDVAEPLVDAMGSLEREELRVLVLDTKNVVTAERTVYRGNLAGSSVRVGEVFRDAVRRCAAAIVVAHNHPSGDPSPSGEDLRITAELADAGRLLDIELLDHLVIGRGRWTSLRALGALGQPPGTMRESVPASRSAT